MRNVYHSILLYLRGVYMNNYKNKKSDFKTKIITRQIDEIDSLRKKISDLEIDNKNKDEIIESINALRNDLINIVNEIKDKSDKYDMLIAEVMQMKSVINKTVFKGRWKLIRFLLK